jgi:carbonic anhydrase/acetyltransferase-like protein (isoleucine patch superfamily)
VVDAFFTSERKLRGRIIEKDGRFFSDSAIVQGDVTLGAGVNVWHQVVIRGDVAPIRLGERVNVQDGAVVHCQTGVALEVDNEVVIGHHAIVHCRRVGRQTLVGTRATVLDGCEIGSNCLIAAGALVSPGTRTPDGVVLMGLPARIVRDISADERAMIAEIGQRYTRLAARHAAGEFPSFV